jgi:hypothetical protein
MIWAESSIHHSRKFSQFSICFCVILACNGLEDTVYADLLNIVIGEYTS